MEMSREQIRELAAAYSLGALDRSDREQFETLLRERNPVALASLKEMQDVADVLPLGVEAVAPPPDLKSRIMDIAEADEAVAPSPRPNAAEEPFLADHLRTAATFWRRLSWGLSFACLLVVAGGFFFFSRMNTEIQSLTKQVEIGNTLINNLESELQKKSSYLAILQAPAVEVVTLNGLEAAPLANATVFLAPAENRALFSAQNLEALPTGKDYQLWMLVGNQPIDAGLLQADAEGRFVAAFSISVSPEDLSAFAVTVEPKGGVPQPTGAMVLLGVVPKGS